MNHHSYVSCYATELSSRANYICSGRCLVERIASVAEDASVGIGAGDGDAGIGAGDGDASVGIGAGDAGMESEMRAWRRRCGSSVRVMEMHR